MKQLIPETSDNNFADYPMTGGAWLTGKDKAPGGGYCFIRTEALMPKGKGHSGYVWGTGSFGFGYYHLLTKDAHKTIYNRILNGKVFTGASDTGVVCGCFGSALEHDAIPTELPVKLSRDQLDVLRILFHARSLSSKANDMQARQDQEAEMKTVAQAHHTYNQNMQTGVFIASQVAAGTG